VLSRGVLTRALGVDPALVRLDAVDSADGEIAATWGRASADAVRHRWRCPHCRQRRPGYDQGRVRRWRTVGFGRSKAFVCARVPRVSCPAHGVVVAAVPWARHAARHTRAFDDVAAWCAVEMSGSAASRLMRCSWRAIGAIVARVATDLRAGRDDLEGLRRIGIDEISYRRHHRYLLVVVDHDRKRQVDAVDGANQATANGFFDAFGPERARQLTHVSADGAPWLNAVISIRAPQAMLCAEPFHIVQWAMEALDEVRRQSWNEVREPHARGKRARGEGKRLKDSRWALWKNPDSLSADEQACLNYIAAAHPPSPCVGVEGRPADRLQAQRRPCRRGLQKLAAMGPAMPNPVLRSRRAADQRLLGTHRRDPHPRLDQRPRRVGQHQNPTHRPQSLSASTTCRP
jgi:transposase